MSTITEEKNDQVRVSAQGPDSVTVSGLIREDKEKFLGAICGRWWLRGGGGKLEFSSGFEKPPSPLVDETMLPFWRRPTAREAATREMLFDPDAIREYSSPSICTNRSVDMVTLSRIIATWLPDLRGMASTAYGHDVETMVGFGKSGICPDCGPPRVISKQLLRRLNENRSRIRSPQRSVFSVGTPPLALSMW